MVCNLLLAHLAWRYLHSTYFARGVAFAAYSVRPADAERLGRAMARAANAVAGVHAHLFAGSDVRVTVKVGASAIPPAPVPQNGPPRFPTRYLTRKLEEATSRAERSVALISVAMRHGDTPFGVGLLGAILTAPHSLGVMIRRRFSGGRLYVYLSESPSVARPLARWPCHCTWWGG